MKKNRFIVLKNDYEVTLLVNALIDCNHKLKNDNMHYVGIYKYNLKVDTISCGDLKYVPESCENLTDWFFKEVNNH